MEKLSILGVPKLKHNRVVMHSLSAAKLQIRRQNSRIIFLTYKLNIYVVTPLQNLLGEMLLMRGHSVSYKGKIWDLISSLNFP